MNFNPLTLENKHETNQEEDKSGKNADSFACSAASSACARGVSAAGC